MKTISYSIVCEDVAHYFFVKRLLNTYDSDQFLLQINENCYQQYRCRTKTEVLNRYVNISNQAFRRYEIDLLIVIVDNDREPADQFSDYHKSLTEPIYQDIKHKVVIAIPVRFIEHWLRYLQLKNENPTSTKNESIEEERSRDSKVKLFDSPKPSSDRTESVINELVKPEYVSWLVSRSVSFNHFSKELNTFINR